MIQKIDASRRYYAKQGWLNTYHLFSFANYYDPENLHFGTLRVFNDDTIDAYSGFGEHGHENMEIVTILFKGTLTHTDSMGNRKKIQAGEVQRMSAGTGVIHSEKNLEDEPVHLYQIWLLPEKQGIEPSYEQKDFSFLLEKNKLTPIASGLSQAEAITMHTDATIYLSELDEAGSIAINPALDRGLFVYVREGGIRINGIEFYMGDQARIQGEDSLSIEGIESASFVAIDVPLHAKHLGL
jgi:redox-sensitive bicupin YhaK (pirin superfamily)